MSDPLLAVESLFAGYEPGVAIVRGANIHVGESEIVAVLGPNGAGKSTLIKAIIGLMPKFAGRVRLADADITQSQAQEELALLSRQLAKQYPDSNEGLTLVTYPLQRS